MIIIYFEKIERNGVDYKNILKGKPVLGKQESTQPKKIATANMTKFDFNRLWNCAENGILVDGKRIEGKVEVRRFLLANEETNIYANPRMHNERTINFQ